VARGFLAIQRGRGVQVADRNGERVGGVGGLRNFIEPEQARDHLLDLVLLGLAVADDGGLDGQRRVLGDFEAGGGGGEHGDAADLSELQGGLHVERVEDVFDGDPVGVVNGDQFFERAGNPREASGHGLARRNLDRAAHDADEAVASTLTISASIIATMVTATMITVTIIGAIIGEKIDDAVAGVFRAAIDAQDAHSAGQCNLWRATLGIGFNRSIREVNAFVRAGRPRTAVPTRAFLSDPFGPSYSPLGFLD